MFMPKSVKSNRFQTSLVFLGLSLTVMAFGIIFPPRVSAAWKAGRIIDDKIFYNGNGMSKSQIQSFLNSKVPDCDRWGQKQHSSGVTRAEWAAANGKPQPPYRCLRDRTFNTNNKPDDEFCNGHTGATKDAATVIKQVANSCGINPKVLLVLLQKEQSLVTDDWPWPIQYRSATGYGCPDTAPCDAEYYGFFNQVYNAARQYRRYRAYPHLYNHIPGAYNNVRFHPNASCGSSSVLIQNQATAGLYNYTPYQPNQAALNAGWGTGNSCSSYGNRNFYRYFTTWFGATRGGTSYKWKPVRQGLYFDAARTEEFPYNAVLEPGQKIYGRVRAKNVGNQVWYQSFMKLATQRPRGRSSKFKNSDWLSKNRLTKMSQSTVSPGEKATFDFTLTAPAKTGKYKEYFSLVAEGVTWLNDPGLYFPIKALKARDFNFYLDAKRTRRIGEDPTVYRGRKIYVRVRILNNTGSTLPQNTRLATTSPRDRASELRDSSWISDNRVAKLGTSVDPGKLGVFKFSMTIPDEINTWNESFGLVIDGGGGWIEEDTMQQTITSVNRPPDRILIKEKLLKGDSITSKDDRFKLRMQHDGNLVIYSPKGSIWATNTAGSEVNRVKLQGDGNLVLRTPSNKAVWDSKTSKRLSLQLIMQNDGNLVIRNHSGKAIWDSGTSGKL